jgi:hypothetical protein
MKSVNTLLEHPTHTRDYLLWKHWDGSFGMLPHLGRELGTECLPISDRTLLANDLPGELSRIILFFYLA